MTRSASAVCFALSVLLSVPATGSAAGVSYSDVAPIMQQHCVMCHSGPSAVRGVRLDTIDGILEGGERGPIVNSGDPGSSELIRRIKGDSTPRMPMTGPPYLTNAEVAVLEEWIASGTPVGKSPERADEEQAAGAEPIVSSMTFDLVAPILATRCAKCHTDNGIMGAPPEGYRLTSYDAVMSPTDRVRVIPGNPAASELLRRIRGQSLPRMPLDGPPWLSPEETSLIEEWIASGAMNSAGEEAAVPIGARVRLEGTLRGRWQLDDLSLEVTSNTRVDKNPRAGDRVRVRGTVREDGTVEVQRVQPR